MLTAESLTENGAHTALEVTVKLSLCLSTTSLKDMDNIEVKLHTSLSSAPDEGDLLASYSSYITPKKGVLHFPLVRLLGRPDSQSAYDGKKKSSCPSGNQIPIIQSIAGHLLTELLGLTQAVFFRYPFRADSRECNVHWFHFSIIILTYHFVCLLVTKLCQ
jgi:hypothetical protein